MIHPNMCASFTNTSEFTRTQLHQRRALMIETDRTMKNYSFPTAQLEGHAVFVDPVEPNTVTRPSL
jgi:hypothetical protein